MYGEPGSQPSPARNSPSSPAPEPLRHFPAGKLGKRIMSNLDNGKQGPDAAADAASGSASIKAVAVDSAGSVYLGHKSGLLERFSQLGKLVHQQVGWLPAWQAGGLPGPSAPRGRGGGGGRGGGAQPAAAAVPPQATAPCALAAGG
jgi:hypothetical protein